MKSYGLWTVVLVMDLMMDGELAGPRASSVLLVMMMMMDIITTSM